MPRKESNRMIALNVRTYLEKNGMSVYEFAHKSGVSPKVIRQMISGSEEGSNHIFNSAPIGKVAAAIGADADVLVNGIADEEQRRMITGAINTERPPARLQTCLMSRKASSWTSLKTAGDSVQAGETTGRDIKKNVRRGQYE